MTHPTSEPRLDGLELAIDLYGAECEACGYSHRSRCTDRGALQARAALLAALPPNQALDDIGVDDGATDGHAVSVNRSSGPSREAVEAAIDDFGARHFNTDDWWKSRARLLALYRPAGETRAGEEALASPLCPSCGGPLWKVTKDAGSMLNDDQFDSIRAGDWYCEHCKGDRAATGYRYFWDRELAALPPSHAGEAK